MTVRARPAASSRSFASSWPAARSTRRDRRPEADASRTRRTRRRQSAGWPIAASVVMVIVPSGGKSSSRLASARSCPTSFEVSPGVRRPAAARAGARGAGQREPRRRTRRATLLTLDVVTPDGRSELAFGDVVDGEQHDLLESAKEWALAESGPSGERRFRSPTRRFGRYPPSSPFPSTSRAGRGRRWRFGTSTRRRWLTSAREAFCRVNDLGGSEAAVDALVRGAMSRLSPGAVLVDADRRPVREGDGPRRLGTQRPIDRGWIVDGSRRPGERTIDSDLINLRRRIRRLDLFRRGSTPRVRRNTGYNLVTISKARKFAARGASTALAYRHPEQMETLLNNR